MLRISTNWILYLQYFQNNIVPALVLSQTPTKQHETSAKYHSFEDYVDLYCKYIVRDFPPVAKVQMLRISTNWTLYLQYLSK